MIAVVVPGSTTKLMSWSTASSAPGYAKSTWSNTTRPTGAGASVATAGAATDGAVPSTSPIRFAHTAARGIMTNMKVAIMTPMRICIM